VKAPYITNSRWHKHYCETSEDVMRAITSALSIMYGDAHSPPKSYPIPYLMLQERVEKNDEVKLIFLNRQFSHIAKIDRNPSSLPPFSTTDLVEFASSILNILAGSDLTFILDGIVRVDVFKSNDGRLVVNELESLEANYYGDARDEARVRLFLENYWEYNIYKSIVSLTKDVN
jgi:hypothetical protein